MNIISVDTPYRHNPNSFEINNCNKIFKHNNNTWVTIYLKRVYTEQIIHYNILINYNIDQFINNIKTWLYYDLNISNIDIIESSNGEDGSSIISDNNITFNEKFVINNKFYAFYYRIRTNEISNNIVNINDCFICFEIKRVIKLSCDHLICFKCYNQLAERQLYSCPYCRRENVIY
jgi:hypothetical protein